MEYIQYEKDAVICNEGDPISNLLFITNGSAIASIDKRTFPFEQGDMLGICDLSIGIYNATYTATSDVTIAAYPYKNMSALETLFRDKSGVAYLMVSSMCRRILSLLQYKILLKNEADKAYESLKEIYGHYEEFCTQYAFTIKKLEGALEAKPFTGLDLIDDWVYTYYLEIKNHDQSTHRDFFSNKPGIAMGFIRKAAEDADNAINSCKDYEKYLDGITEVFLNNDGHDLFGIVSELHIEAIDIRGADTIIKPLVNRLTKLMESMTFIDIQYYHLREEGYKQNLLLKQSTLAKLSAGLQGNVEPAVESGSDADTLGDAVVGSSINRNLLDSLNVILDYSECTTELCSTFARDIRKYELISDKGSADDDVYALRKQLTSAFYEIYQRVFEKSLGEPTVPTIIKMFLNFGYVDAALAGPENADFLYSIADSLKGNPEKGIYTISEWLTAVYNGDKDPCRSELDVDYPTYVKGLKTSDNLSDTEVNRLLVDSQGKLRFELENVFPVTNRVTFGSVSTFCPVFSGHNVIRPLDVTMLTASAVENTINDIRNIDFSAYYRPMMFEYPELGASPSTTKETLHVEVLPDIILMPNVGTRGIMWQDIEGRRRNTPSRMFVPMFLQNDVKALFIKLTSEFRWELCKRIQGARWNDLTDPSITSEFCDYLQFYKSNRDLSAEAKENIKSVLVRARNNYKSVFSTYYSDWINYESNGISRLNKQVRKMLFTYCPFPAEIREKLKSNPQYLNLSNRYTSNQKKREKQLTYIMQKFTSTGKQVPQELFDEQEYIAK
ncbi:MAG: hypothetical protein FWG88_00670 [Oscillospiraceae bacterium]|nr:hypothetical protein [Oscillospiraceae bacterium]